MIFWRMICLIVFLFACAPMLIPGLPQGSDDTFHLGRFYSLGMAICNGVFPAQIRPILCYRYGYGEGFFYADLFLYLPALLIAGGVSTVVVFKIYMILVFAGIMFSMYHAVCRMTNNREISMFCACMYLLSYRVFGQYYLEFSIGTVTAAAFIPLVIAGFYLILEKNQGWAMFIVGCLGCVGSHVISTVLAASICFLMLCLEWKKVFLDKEKRKHLLISLLFMIVISGAYWLPMLEQFHSIRFKNQIHWAVEEENVVGLPYLLQSRGTGLGIILCACVMLFLCVRSVLKKKTLPKGALLFGGLGLLYLLLPSCYLFWHLVNQKVTLIQFPTRLYQPASALLLFGLSFFFSIQDRKKVFMSKNTGIRANVLGAALVLVSLLSAYKEYYRYIGSQIGYSDMEWIESGEIACAGSGQEWMPIEMDVDALTDPEAAYSASGVRVQGEKLKGDSVFIFEADPNEEWYDVPFTHYEGYRAVDEEGNEYTTTGDYQNGLLRVMMPESDITEKERTITVSYHWTRWQIIGYLMSAVGCIWGFLLAKRRWCRGMDMEKE